MMPFASRFPVQSRQLGASVISAIFLLLLMAALAAAMVSVVSTAHVNLAADIGGAKAYQAARAGAEWGMYQLDPNAQSPSLPTCLGGTPPIPDHAVTVTCSRSTYTEAGRQIGIYRIVSVATASVAKAPGIERSVEVTLEKCRDSAITVAPYDC
ncbi:hypothetical protein [Ferribacterium limneticum]|uniref:hypothetical protein n=1 Tax=Ferribacterium limneticum TaxID=76259 RepID=UPI001CFB687F|nr:hypothetical protein [Ferribacterium limneticum]UCV27511.1 hypothetical protein KI617_14715 [Ferribacterium limneticum]UCV31428.1 hypothetical protein KI608_14715 [Ferribacterium limneticum]